MTPGGQAQIGNVDLVKQLNSAAVYRLIDQYGPISRIQIAEQSQLAPASVTKITRQLIERGLIKEVDPWNTNAIFEKIDDEELSIQIAYAVNTVYKERNYSEDVL